LGTAEHEQPFVIPDVLPMLPLRDIVVYPRMSVPLAVGRKSSIDAVEAALAADRLLFVATQKNAGEDDPSPDDIYAVGTVCLIARNFPISDDRLQVLVQGVAKAQVVEYIAQEPFFRVRLEALVEPHRPASKALSSLLQSVKRKIAQLLPLTGLSPEIVSITDSIDDPGQLADVVTSNLKLKIEQVQHIFEIVDPLERLQTVSELLSKELELSTMQSKIESEAREELNEDQRESFLRDQMQAILDELGEVDERADEASTLRQKIEDAHMPPEAEREARKQLRRLSRMHQDAAEATVVRTYLDWLVDLPWNKRTSDNLNLRKARQVLDEDHYDLDNVKERILEYLSVRKLKRRMKGPILCLVGPPGVGKTSLGRSIARAMGRKFVRISLGGIRDEAEIRGHRRTYVGALPGRIVQGIKEAGSCNPVFMLDEVDKIGTDFRGDPSSALLEVLDPEQNHAFSDHYLNLPIDLSRVLFITTANVTDPIPPALFDRMETIDLPGYTEVEKVNICKEFLLPRQIEENGLRPEHVHISEAAVRHIITDYTREAGLRNLERELASICRKVARRIAERGECVCRITRGNVHKYLGVPMLTHQPEQNEDEIGVATGLAWTQAGGETLHVEASTMEGQGTLTITGFLGDIMKESAQAALSYTRSRAGVLGIKESVFERRDIHIHVPAGAIPKDGPSAGVTIATAIISALTQRPVRRDVAMTGEITLRGRVLPVGGLKEKVLAALRAKIDTVVIPEKNRKDLSEIPAHVRRRLQFVYASRMDDVLPAAFSHWQTPLRAGGAKTSLPKG
jgi:ATP-dependent Lon protease